MRKVISLLMVCVMLVCCTVMATAVSVSPSDVNETREAQKIARVKAEVLSGNITNEQDVIEVALAQYVESVDNVSTVATYSIGETSESLLTITQSVGSYVDENGNTYEDFISTGLVLTDETGDLVTAAEAYEYHSGSSSNSLSGLNLRATVTLSLKSYVETNAVRYYKPNYVRTTINDAGVSINTMRQSFGYNDTGGLQMNEMFSSVVTGPTEGQSYYYYPYDSWRTEQGSLGLTYGGRAYIYTGSGTLRVGVKASIPTSVTDPTPSFSSDYEFQTYG